MIVENLIAMGETDTLEFMEIPNSDPKRYLKTVCAFANYNGGSIIFGVSDNGEIRGVQGNVTRIRDQIVDTIFSNISPPIFPRIYIHTVDGKDLIVVDVPACSQRPVYVRSEGQENGTYVRFGSTTRRAEKIDLAMMEFDSSFYSPDSVRTDNTTMAEDDDRITELCRKLSKRKGDEVDVKDLVSLGLLSRSEDRYLPNMAFRLLTDNPYPFATLECARFIGSAETEFSDRTECKGSILSQVDCGIEYILSKIDKPSVIDGIVRKDMFEIPVAAIREVVLNAVMHRSYMYDLSAIKIAVYDDRVEVTSPGRLPQDQTIEKMMDGCSIPRNRLIATVFKECKLSEGWGRGIRKVFELCREEGLDDPRIEVFGYYVKVILFRKSRKQQSLTSVIENERKVVSYFAENPTSTIAELCSSSDLTKHDAEVAISSLKGKGVLRRVGARKRGMWMIEGDLFEEK